MPFAFAPAMLGLGAPKNPYYSGPVSDHFDGLRFFVPGGPDDKTLGDLLRMARGARKRAPWPASRPEIVPDRPPPRVEGRNLRVSYVGHSSFLVQTEGLNLLIDPVWARRAGPWGRIGPTRVTAPGIAFSDLPKLDAILLSHNHYDHMDLATLSRLARERPCPVLTPLGNDTILRRYDSKIDARAFDWGQRAELGPATVHVEPAYHWSARGRGDRRMALWGSFVIETPSGKIYFAGDTGFHDGAVFHDIRRRHGPMRLALIPIGAYEPRWFMKEQHCDPHEAVEIFRRLDADMAFGCHWGTFRLTDEAYLDPVERLAAALAQAGIYPARFRATPPGSAMELR